MNVMRLFRRPKAAAPERAVYEAIVSAARHPRLYEALGVADTLDGRFDMIVLHMFLVLDRLRGSGTFAQALVDEMFRDMDRSLREMGVSDPAVPKRARRMAEVYAGRIEAYKHAMAAGPAELASALGRNVFAGGPGDAEGLAAYMADVRSALVGQDLEAIREGRIAFGEPQS